MRRRTLIVLVGLLIASFVWVSLYLNRRWEGGGGRPGEGLQSRSHAQMLELAEAAAAASILAELTIDYPLNEAVFPPQFPPPTFVWHDPAAGAVLWLVDAVGTETQHMLAQTRGDATVPAPSSPPEEISQLARAYRPGEYQLSARRWRPPRDFWRELEKADVSGPVTVRIVGLDVEERPISRGTVQLRISTDPVGAPIFYRDVPLPFSHALDRAQFIRWRLGEVTSEQTPRIVLAGMEICGNCHSFTRDGSTLAMDVDYANDKGSYVIAPVEPQTILDKERVITWSDYRREDNHKTFGLLSQISPDGRYVVSTVKDRSVFVPVADLYYSQLFFPIRGILVVYDRQTRQFFALPGADDPHYVQSNPTWSPDGKTIVFARSEAYELKGLRDSDAFVISREEAIEFFQGKQFHYDLCRIDFNEGRGGTAMPIDGASANGMSNYFPKYSPDGRWIVFCRARSFMLLQPDSLLYIMPAAGGTARKMRCNREGAMNSWHSWSPNGRWLVFSSKANGPFTQLWLTHVDEEGNDAPPVVLDWFTAADRAANIPEFANLAMDQLVSISPEFADYYTHFRVAIKYIRLKEHDPAIAELRQVIQEKPDHVEAFSLIAMCLIATGRSMQAIDYLQKLVQLDPARLDARARLGALLALRGDYHEAIGHLEHVLRLDPDNHVAANDLAWLLATCPDGAFRDGRRAVELGERMCRATGNAQPVLLETLAAAYAEAGQFPAAVATAEKALSLRRGIGEVDTQWLEQRLSLYRAEKAYRQK